MIDEGRQFAFRSNSVDSGSSVVRSSFTVFQAHCSEHRSNSVCLEITPTSKILCTSGQKKSENKLESDYCRCPGHYPSTQDSYTAVDGWVSGGDPCVVAFDNFSFLVAVFVVTASAYFTLLSARARASIGVHVDGDLCAPATAGPVSTGVRLQGCGL